MALLVTVVTGAKVKQTNQASEGREIGSPRKRKSP